MGARGPAPTPAEVLKLRGSPRAKGRSDGPALEVEAPDRPRWLKKEARAEWDRVAALLVRQRVLTQLDRAFLAAYCVAWARWQKVLREVEAQGEMALDAAGREVPSPRLRVLDAAFDAMAKAARELGLSPASRARVLSVPAEPESESSVSTFARKRAT
jgi:P27 family predicted phage terminase small subunit